MPQQYNFIPQGGFGGQNMANFSRGAQALSQGLQSIHDVREDRDYKSKLGEAVKNKKGFQELMAAHPKRMAETMTAFGFQNKQDVENTRKDMGELASAMSYSPEAAMKLLEDRKKAYINSGDEEKANNVDSFIQKLKTDPDRFKTMLKTHHSAMFPDDAKKISETAETEQKVEKYEEQFQLDKDKLANDVKAVEVREATLAQRRKENPTAEQKIKLEEDEQAIAKEANRINAEKLKMTAREKINERVTDANDAQTDATKMFVELNSFLNDLTGVSAQDFGGGALDKFTKQLQTTLSGQEWGKNGHKMTALRTMSKKIQVNQAMANRVVGSGSMSDFETKSLMQTSLPDSASKEATIDFINARINMYRSAYAAEAIKKAYWQKFRTEWPTGKEGQFIEVGGKKIPVGPKDDPNAIIWRLKENVRDYAGTAIISPETPDATTSGGSAYEQFKARNKIGPK